MDARNRQAIGHGQGLCPAAPPLGGRAHPCLAEPQPPAGEGCREDDRERGNLAIYCQRQAHVTPSGCGLIACHRSWLLQWNPTTGIAETIRVRWGDWGFSPVTR